MFLCSWTRFEHSSTVVGIALRSQGTTSNTDKARTSPLLSAEDRSLRGGNSLEVILEITAGEAVPVRKCCCHSHQLLPFTITPLEMSSSPLSSLPWAVHRPAGFWALGFMAFVTMPASQTEPSPWGSLQGFSLSAPPDFWKAWSMLVLSHYKKKKSGVEARNIFLGGGRLKALLCLAGPHWPSLAFAALSRAPGVRWGWPWGSVSNFPTHFW